LIRLENVSLSFDQPVLKNVTLHVPSGKLFGLVGPGASGKSVLLKLIPRLLSPTSGHVIVDGTDVADLDQTALFELRKRIGMLFQNNALFDFMTVEENIAFPLRQLLGLGSGEAAPRVSARLEQVGLPGFEQRYPAGLSGGQKKRVGVARATITQAPIVLYDEPAAGLDPVSSQKLFELLRAEQQEHGTTVLMVSSDIDRLLPVTDYVGMMLKGELIFQGTTAQAFDAENPAVRQFLRGELEGPL
jgi:phospholipid/cholesterol/gamma-HCH transport system ATP-binding protein